MNQLMPHIPSSSELGWMGPMAKSKAVSLDGASEATGWGRLGDTHVVHAAPGEMMVPPQVLEQYPEVGHIIAQALQNMGENPNQYVVGSSSNSINPYTGQPEFLFGGLKKIFKKVIKAVTKIPIIGNAILPVAASFAAPFTGGLINPATAAALTAGLQTKVQGGSWGQAIGAGAGSFLGSKIGGPSFGNSSVGGVLTNKVGGALGSLSPAVGSAFQGMVAQLPNAITSASMGAVTGAYLGSSIGQGIGGMIDPPKASWGNQMANVPQIKNIEIADGVVDPQLALPDGSSSDGSAPSKGTGVNLNIPGGGLNYLTTVKDRNTGAERTVNSAFGGNFNTDRRNTWGSSGVSFS